MNHCSLTCPGSLLGVFKRDNGAGGFRRLAAVLFLAMALPLAAHEPVTEQLIRVVTERDGDRTQFYVQNLQATDVTVTFEMELTNLTSTNEFPCTATYPAGKTTRAFCLHPKEEGKPWNWGYTYHSTLGSMSAVHDDGHIYALPYDTGEAFRVSQGYNGKYSHFGANQYAIDWRMPSGTPVRAARGGVVVGARDDSDVGGADTKFEREANFILIQHSDGTLGHYVHLSKGGNRVRVGQTVQTGDWIGLSGNTGHSTGPHLHFSIFKAGNGKQRQTIPVRFRTSNSTATTLVRGRAYKSPGMDVAETVATHKSSETPAVGAP